MSSHLSSLILDRLALGDLGAAEEQAARAHLESCDRCRSDFATLESSRAEHAAELPRYLRAIRARMPQTAPANRWRWLFAAMVPALAALILVIARPKPPDPELGIKGGATLRAYLRRDGKVLPLKDRDHARPGDEMRFVVTSTGQPWLLIASVDSTGKATIYHPYAGDRSAALAPDAVSYEVPGSIVLDDTTGPERLFALFSRSPLTAAEVKTALESIGSRGAPAIRDTQKLTLAADQATLLLEKDPR